jgi:RHS repeat-associated protein
MAPTGSSTVKYAGKALDSATGLYYSGARWYDSASGRFMTEDTKTGTQSVPLSENRYVYAQGNPMTNVDPTGHYDVCSACGGASTDTVTQANSYWSLSGGYLTIQTVVTTGTYVWDEQCSDSGQCALSSIEIASASTTYTTTITLSNPFLSGVNSFSSFVSQIASTVPAGEAQAAAFVAAAGGVAAFLDTITAAEVAITFGFAVTGIGAFIAIGLAAADFATADIATDATTGYLASVAYVGQENAGANLAGAENAWLNGAGGSQAVICDAFFSGCGVPVLS